MAGQDKWAVVLGASSGSGHEIALALAADPGLHIFGVHRGNYPDEAAALADSVAALGKRAHFVILDAGTPAGTAAGIAALREVAPERSVRIFVHSIANASLGRMLPGGEGRFRQLQPRNFHKTMDSMANSFVYWAQGLHKYDLLAPQARLLGLTNPISDSLINNFAAITAAKAALEVYIRHLAWELGPLGHRVNLLNFGTVDTTAVRAAFTPERFERFQAVVARAIPAGRMLTTAEVGRFVSRLLDPDAAWFNGASIDFTGGQSQGLLDALIYDEWQHERPDDHGSTAAISTRVGGSGVAAPAAPEEGA